MKRIVGMFLSLSSLLTYLIVEELYDPLKGKIIKSGVTTVTYNYPSMYWAICVILIITFILGVYFILAKEKETKESPSCDTPKYTNESTRKNTNDYT